MKFSLAALLLPAFVQGFSATHGAHRSIRTDLRAETNEVIETVVAGVDDVDSKLELETNFVEKEEAPVDEMENIKAMYSSPAEYEEVTFKCDENTQLWKDYNMDGNYQEADFLNDVATVSSNFISKGSDAVGYWARHNARSGYFLTTAVLGTLSSSLHERLRNQEQEDGFANAFSTKVIAGMLSEVALSYEQDYERIEQGKYKKPYDMYTQNRQNNPFYFGQQTSRFISEAIGTIARRNRGTEDDKRTWLTDNPSTELYPDYYKTAFHYQTDGWMSQDSANVYETSTETLFLGRQDAMQRTALVPLVEFANEMKDIGRPLKILEVACGTGRFMTFARDNLPLDTEFTAVDLSPFYLDKARDNDKNWRNIRKRSESGDTKITPATFIQAKAEDLPFENEEYDAVICMYLYHEIPREIRAKAASEMARVTKKGGKVILTDSYQLGDRPGMNPFMKNFEKMNEPHYVDFIEDFLPLHFEKEGLIPDAKIFCSRTKTLSFTKPE